MFLKKITTRCSQVAMLLGIVWGLLGGVRAYGQDAASSAPDPALLAGGKKLFEDNCAQCHAVHEQVVGPALKDVTKRQKPDWVKAFILNSQKVIQSGDKYAVGIYEKFGKLEMPSHDFSPEELNALIAYIDDESTKTPVAEAPVAVPGAGGEAVSAGAGTDSGMVTIILVVNLVILVLILVVLALIVNVLTKYLNQKDDLAEDEKEIVNQRFNLRAALFSKPVVAFSTLLFVAIVTKTVLDGLFQVGVQTGYAPKQPIAFSHEIHAGQYEIDCNYCHTGVTKSKNANIPSANICMNCHSSVKTDSKEIAKIYAALDYNKDTKTYGPNQKPIEWVRVHNLPDLAYFNHSQHVKVGGIECQTCHGPIEEMAVVRQHNNLTMGWCISCHRETKVNAEGNAYYDKLVAAHNKANGKKKAMTVSDAGGLECSKCHY
ncbi:c-type cytochrome [Fulvitalea axinellae]